MKYAIIDIETTGTTNAGKGRITEIAIYIHDGSKIVGEFCSLINPECKIPPFISRLTGISDEMVESAPKFYEVAKEIVNITEGAVFVAHNASFDYNFIRQEYKSLGYNYEREYMCTLQLSRKFLPGYNSYSLGKLCRSLDINIENRHRAHGDALATVKLFELIIQKNESINEIHHFIRNDFLNLRFPPGFNRTKIEKLPENPGVYYLHNEFGNIIYIGKSNNIRKRVLSHFANKQNRRYVEMRNSIADISYEETGSELIALLLESEEIKKKKPVFNRKQKSTFLNYSIVLSKDELGYLKLSIEKKSTEAERIITINSFDEGESILEKLLVKYNLCKKFCGTEEIIHSCFSYSVKQCKGACVGKESTIEYNKRVDKALDSLRFNKQNFMIVGEGRSSNEKSVVQIEKGKYVGFGYFDPDFYGKNPEEIKSCIKPRNDNRDVRQIIRSYINKVNEKNVIVYSS